MVSLLFVKLLFKKWLIVSIFVFITIRKETIRNKIYSLIYLLKIKQTYLVSIILYNILYNILHKLSLSKYARVIIWKMLTCKHFSSKIYNWNRRKSLHMCQESTYHIWKNFYTTKQIPYCCCHVSKVLFFLKVKAFFFLKKKISIKFRNRLKYCTKYDEEVTILLLFNCKYCYYVKQIIILISFFSLKGFIFFYIYI